jgi:hypothetical protein
MTLRAVQCMKLWDRRGLWDRADRLAKELQSDCVFGIGHTARLLNAEDGSVLEGRIDGGETAESVG